MNTEQLKILLADLTKREEALSQITKDLFFKTKEEAEQFINDNRAQLQELKAVRQQIWDIEWELLTDKEKEEKKKMWEEMKKKHAND